MNMGLGDKGLQRKGKNGDKHDEAPSEARTPHSKQFRQFFHRACNCLNPQSYAASGTLPQPGGGAGDTSLR